MRPYPLLALGLFACSNDPPMTSSLTSLTTLPSGFDDGPDDDDDSAPGPSSDPTGAPTEATDSASTESSPTTNGPASDPDTTNPGPASDPDTTNPGPSSDPDATAEGPPCRGWMESPVPSRARVMLVLDKSGSMGVDSWDHDQNANTATVTRWSVLRNVLGAVLPAHDDALELGAQLYPSKAATSDYSSAACPVAAPEVPVDSHNAASILAAIPVANDVTIKGGQPTAAALRSATDELQGLGGSSPRYIVLVADGAANCMAGAPDTTSLFEDYDTDAVDAAFDAYAAGIPTFVLGVNASVFPAGNVKDGNPDGVAASDTLAELAAAGGTDYVNASTQTELQAAYDDFLAATRYCGYALDSSPPNPDQVIVTLGGVEIPFRDSCNAGSGWTFAEGTSVIEFCGAACDDFLARAPAQAYEACE